jgi:amino acid permease
MLKYRVVNVAVTLLLLLHHEHHESVAFVLSGHSSSSGAIGRGLNDKSKNLPNYHVPKSKTALYDSTAAADPSSLPIGSGGSQEGASVSGGTATMSNEIFNLIKSIVGAGVLSLPAGIAAFANAPSAVLPASILIALIGGVSGYCFSLIGRVCAMEDASSYMDAWEKTVGSKTSIIPVAACTLSTCSANLAYSMILADTFKTLLASVGVNLSRSNTLFGVTGLILLPLCLLKNLSSLAPFSLLGIIGMAYTALAMTLRYMGGGYKLPDGKFLSGVAANLQPSFGAIGAKGVFRPSSLILISSLSTAFMAHFNAPKFYKELKNNTIRRYNTVVGTSFGVSIAIFSTMAAMGFLTFGQAASGLILNNYSVSDRLIGLSRIAVAMSIVFS